MATDSIYPVGINTTTGLPERASTPYSGIVGDFVNVLAGGSSGGAQQSILNSAAASVISLTVANSADDGYSILATGGVSGMPAVAMAAFGTNFATAAYAGNPIFRGTPLASKVTMFQSADSLDAAMPFEYHVGAISSTSKMFRIGIEGQDPITISPTILAANTDDYDPTSFAGSEIIRISASSAVDLTGLVAPTTGSRRVTLWNVGAENITIVNNATSTAANRFQTSIGINTVLAAGAAVTLVYDDTASRWKDESYNMLGVYTTLGFVFNTLYIQTNGGAGTQAVQLDADAETSITVQNDDTGTAAVAGLGVVCDGNTLSIGAFSDANGVQPGKVRISTNSTNGLDIDCATTTNYQSGAVTKMAINAMGRADGFDNQAFTAVGETLTPTAPVMVISSDGNYTLTSTPTIAAGTANKQRLTIEYTGANTITFQRESALAGSTLRLGAATRAMSEYDTLELIWNGTYWLETSFTDNT